MATGNVVAGTLTVVRTLDSAPSETFTLEFFTSDACDPSGFGKGAFFAGAIDVTTDPAGHADFTAHIAWGGRGEVVAATAFRDALLQGCA